MSFNRYSRRRDANSPEIIKAFLKNMVMVWEIERPIDLLCADHAFFTVEVKTPGGRERKGQIRFRKDCEKMSLPHYIVYSVDDVNSLCKSRSKR